MQQVKEYLSETVSCEVTVKRLKSGKHIFSHVEWHMCGYEIILPEGKPQDVVHGLLLCDLSRIGKISDTGCFSYFLTPDLSVE